MKEFEKWLEALDSIQVAGKFNNQNRAIAGCAWEAALRWALLSGSWEKVTQEIREELFKTDAKT